MAQEGGMWPSTCYDNMVNQIQDADTNKVTDFTHGWSCISSLYSIYNIGALYLYNFSSANSLEHLQHS